MPMSKQTKKTRKLFQIKGDYRDMTSKCDARSWRKKPGIEDIMVTMGTVNMNCTLGARTTVRLNFLSVILILKQENMPLLLGDTQ